MAALDLESFYAAYRGDGRARPAHEPAMMVGLMLYAYARGVRSSRATERACMEDLAYRVPVAQAKPDHATLARSIERHQDTLAGVFGAVLGLCAMAGLVGINVVAVDGSKVSGERQPRSDRRLRAFGARDHRLRAGDRRRGECFGDRRCDESPPEVATSAGRRQWFRSRSARSTEAEMRAEQAYQRYQARGVERRGGRLGPNTVPRPNVPPPEPEGTINTTDLGSRARDRHERGAGAKRRDRT